MQYTNKRITDRREDLTSEVITFVNLNKWRDGVPDLVTDRTSSMSHQILYLLV